MSDDPNTWVNVLRDQGIAAAVGAFVVWAVTVFKNRTSIVVLVEKMDTVHEDLRRIARAVEAQGEASARQDERIKNLEKRL